MPDSAAAASIRSSRQHEWKVAAATVRHPQAVAGDADPVEVDPSRQLVAALVGQASHLVDHEADVRRLVDEVGGVRDERAVGLV